MEETSNGSTSGGGQDAGVCRETTGVYTKAAGCGGSGGFLRPVNQELLREFFNLTGGSLFYCFSAVLVAYGAARLLGPVLSGTDTFTAALPCVGTLWLYELALLGVLVFIVSRKVVDDAVSVVIIIALYLVAGSIALGTVADRNIEAAVVLGLLGVALAIGKVYAMHRMVQIPFGALSLAGVAVLVWMNYFGPMWMSRLMVGDAAEEAVRRGRWFLIQMVLLAGAGLVVWEAARAAVESSAEQGPKRVFLQSPIMVYVFALVLLAASGVHAYAMGYMYALEEFVGDYLPLLTVGSLLALEILRRTGLPFGPLHVATACVPLATLGYAIWAKSVGTTGELACDLMAYPPVFCGLSGAAVAALAWRRRWRPLAGVVFLYGLGLILTLGYSLEEAHSLNMRTGGAVLAAAMMAYGIESWRQHYCVAAVGLMTLGAAASREYMVMAAGWNVTEVGAVMGIGGVGIIGLALLFGKALDRAWRLVGAGCLMAFTYDLVGPDFGGRYVAAIIITAALGTGLWYRTRDRLSVVLLTAGVGARIYLATRVWRYVVLGFAALAAGVVASLRKRRSATEPATET